MVVLDTSALIYWTLDADRLSLPAASAIAEADRVIVSSISLWEIGLKVKRGKLEIPLSVREYYERLKSVDRVEIWPVDVDTWLRNLELAWDHRDPADRTIVATAQGLGCALVTSDARIRAFYPLATW